MRRRAEQAAISRLAGKGRVEVCVIHPGALPVSCWRALADQLAPETSACLLELDAVAEYRDAALVSGPPAISVDEIADRLCTDLELVGLSDTLTLVGWSFGGVIAYAMADRIPARVVLLDSVAPVGPFAQSNDSIATAVLLDWFAMYLGARRGATLAIDVRELRRPFDEALAHVLRAGVACGALRTDTPLAGLRKAYETYAAGLYRNNDLARAYRAEPSARPLMLLKASHSLLTEPWLGWDLLAEVQLMTVPGDHYTLLSDGLAFAPLARALRHLTAAPPTSSDC
ncbi:thioesterase domain-containing protein [Solirubrobacter taibaiensis]|nr:thioesterase domain-containing protein [Solirubrobacter taibaiensis]